MNILLGPLIFSFAFSSEFCSMVRKIFIYTVEEVKELSPKAKLPLKGEFKPGKPDSKTTIGTEDHSSMVGSGF